MSNGVAERLVLRGSLYLALAVACLMFWNPGGAEVGGRAPFALAVLVCLAGLAASAPDRPGRSPEKF